MKLVVGIHELPFFDVMNTGGGVKIEPYKFYCGFNLKKKKKDGNFLERRGCELDKFKDKDFYNVRGGGRERDEREREKREREREREREIEREREFN